MFGFNAAFNKIGDLAGTIQPGYTQPVQPNPMSQPTTQPMGQPTGFYQPPQQQMVNNPVTPQAGMGGFANMIQQLMQQYQQAPQQATGGFMGGLYNQPYQPPYQQPRTAQIGFGGFTPFNQANMQHRRRMF